MQPRGALPYGDSLWYEWPNLWEPTVMLALRDLLRPGDVAFDLGANLGGLTSAMARLVGPRGVVCSFEASPRIVKHLQHNVVVQGHRNVTVYNRAVYTTSNMMLELHEGGHLNDSLYVRTFEGRTGASVRSLALDDFCDATRLDPALMKLDIEGAELDALKGGERMLARATPHLVMEEDSDNMRCFEYLSARGYRAIDLHNYREITQRADYPPGRVTRNTLFIHRDKIGELPYALPPGFEPVRTLSSADFRRDASGDLTSTPLALTAGRYIIDLTLSAQGTDNNMFCGVRCNGHDLLRYQSHSKLIADMYHEWVVDVPPHGTCELYFKFLGGTSDTSFALQTVALRRMSDVRPNLWPALAME